MTPTASKHKVIRTNLYSKRIQLKVNNVEAEMIGFKITKINYYKSAGQAVKMCDTKNPKTLLHWSSIREIHSTIC